MAGRIQQLPERVAIQIAAGEVVERPVAVIKELVENSLDAGARCIEVYFEQGGKAEMRVCDDGHGMDPEDARMALQRHATSKIRCVEDILGVGSFGFRGEALPSIASVSRFQLKTRPADCPQGTEILLDGGKLIHERACGMSPGSEICVTHLFHPVPARRKFMKTDRTEAAHIIQMVRLLAIAHPRVAFRLVEDGHPVFDSPACEDHRQRVAEIFGRRRADEYFALDQVVDGVRFSGLLGEPGIGRSTRAEMVTYVNQRPVDSRLLSYALIESYHRYLPRGRYPVAFLFVAVPAGEVDVNVHPSKREVRFRNEARIRQLLMSALEPLLADRSRSSLAGAERVEPLLADAASANPSTTDKPTPSLASTSMAVQPNAAARMPPPVQALAMQSLSPRALPGKPALAWPGAGRDSNPATADSRAALPTRWRFLAALPTGFGLFSSGDSLYILHPRAARERIEFERIHGLLRATQPPTQPLLIPALLELPPLEAGLLGDQLPFFTAMGFEVEPFGRHLYRMRAAPAWIGMDSAEAFLEELVQRIRDRGIRPDDQHAALTMVARLAARRVARSEAPADPLQWEQLVAQLLACDNPLFDSRGRPAFFELRNAELRRRLMLDADERNPSNDD